LALLGYNLWRNGNNIHFVPAPDTFYIDPAVGPGTWEYYVSAVYDEGESFWDGPGVVTIIARGSIEGLVYHPTTNEPLADATVTLEPGGYTTQTGNNGRYSITDIPIGYYVVTGSKTGYTSTSLNAQIKYNHTTTVDIPLYTTGELRPIPFYEFWNDGNFTANAWSFDPTPGNWVINTFTGNPAPAAEFNWSPTVTGYSFALVSVGLDARNLTENVTVEFDLYLSNYGSTGLEFMDVDVWDGAAWVNVAQFPNVGDIVWEHHAYDVSQYALGKITKVRFVAHGADSYQINNWDIDNIQVHEVIMATLQGTVTSAATGDPIEGAIISIAGYDPEYTNAQGFYTINVIQGTHTVTASAAGYLQQVAEDVMVEGITTRDFALEPEPCLPPLNLAGEVVNIFDVQLTWQSPTAVDRSTKNKSLLGYNVYRDGVKINTVVETQYTDMDLATGTYTYYVTAQYTLCESEPSNEVVVVITGIDELANGKINVYPVPATDYVNVEVSDNVRELRVVNYVGQVVLEQNVGQEKSFQLNTSTLSSGSYMIEFTSEDGNIITKRLVIAR
jgi:hypothetical protein